MPADLEETLLSLEMVGLRVNNLFQLDDGTWQANVRNIEPADSGPPGRETDRFCHHFGRGATPSAALKQALTNAA